MAASDAVKHMTDRLFETMDLLSANTYETKSGGTVCTMRFVNPPSDHDSEPKTFVRKHRYHIKRDRERSELFKKNCESKRTRQQTKFYDSSIENTRGCSDENAAFSLSLIHI